MFFPRGLSPDHNAEEVLRPDLPTLGVGLVELNGLRLGFEKHSPCRFFEVPIHVVDVLDNANDLIGAGILYRAWTEVLPDGILVGEKLLGKGFC